MSTITSGNTRHRQENKFIHRTSSLIEEVTQALIDTSTILRDITANLIVENIPVKMQPREDTTRNRDLLARYLSRRLYIVTGFGLSVHSVREVVGSLRVKLDSGQVEVYYIRDPSNPYLMITVDNFIKYTYPPRDYISHLFLNLNQDIRDKITRLVEEKKLPDNVMENIIEVELVNKKLDSITINIDEVLDPDKLVDRFLVAEAEIDFSTVIETFNSIKSSIYVNDVVEKEVYTVTVKDNGDIGIYNLDLGNVHKGVKILVKYFTSREDQLLIKTVTARLRDTAIKSYIVVITLLKT